MNTFLEETLIKLKQEYLDLSTLIIILPSKRACGFFLNYLKKNNHATTFAPKIISVEEFIEDVSGLKIIDNTELLFESYKIYLKTSPNQVKDSFEVYATWANALLSDFNEIDRYLIPTKQFFNYLSSIQDINNWYVQKNKTELVENYLKFWNSLPSFYEELKAFLLNKNLAYQGLVYREAAENIEHYINIKNSTPHIFIGFNALNNAEQSIIQELLEIRINKIFWDVDTYFLKNKSHSASYFFRKYLSEWKYYLNTKPNTISDNYLKDKKIAIIEVQKNISQIKYVSEILSKLTPNQLNETAVVLADENLLNPLLYSLPANIEKVNITMGVSLNTYPIAIYFSMLLGLHGSNDNNYYYKDVFAILNHPITLKLYPNSKQLLIKIAKNNLTYLTLEKIINFAEEENQCILSLLFSFWKNNSKIAISNCINILLKLKIIEFSILDRVTIFRVFETFQKINFLNEKFDFFNSIKSVQKLYSEIISTATIDYQGDAYNGLQIMGVLESRTLDFKNVIITSVNEGVLPSGKSNNSFITYDLKKEFNLPTYTEKDAIYTYHFYRLLHRANNITILYNNFSDGISTGEKSRFISQIENEQIQNHTIQKNILNPLISIYNNDLKRIKKTDAVLDRIKEIAGQGFSPSSLTTYIRNPLDFYFEKILGIKDVDEVEETVAANTLGSIIHDTLEVFYKPFKGNLLTLNYLLEIKKNVSTEVEKQFKKHYNEGNYIKGKNLIIFEVAKHLIISFINSEIEEIKKGNEIKIISIEKEFIIELSIPELDFPVKIRGKVDRIDEFNGKLRIIDYKTGVVEPRNLEINNWENVFQDYKYSKIVQVLAYALMYKNHSYTIVEAGIISFKKQKNGFMKFAIKGRPKQTNITYEVLNQYKEELIKLILEICNKEIPFVEKEV